MPKGTDVDAVIDRLYALDPEEFTEERNAAARELRASGDRAASDRVKALRKPTAVAWAVNQLSRRSPRLVDELLDAGGSLRSAQRAALSGSGKALREATRQRRAAVARLVEEASKVFRDAGRSPAAHVDAVRSTLEAASTDEAVGDLVRSGRLTKEVDAPAGFGDVSGFEVLLGGKSSPPAGKAARAAESAEEVGTPDEGAAEAETAAAKRVRERLEAKVAKSEDAVMAARKKAAQAREHARSLVAEVDRVDRELQTLRRRSDRATKDAATADSRLDDAERALEKAQSELGAR